MISVISQMLINIKYSKMEWLSLLMLHYIIKSYDFILIFNVSILLNSAIHS